MCFRMLAISIVFLADADLYLCLDLELGMRNYLRMLLVEVWYYQNKDDDLNRN